MAKGKKKDQVTSEQVVSLEQLHEDPKSVLEQTEQGSVSVVDEQGKEKLVLSSPIITNEELLGTEVPVEVAVKQLLTDEQRDAIKDAIGIITRMYRGTGDIQYRRQLQKTLTTLSIMLKDD